MTHSAVSIVWRALILNEEGVIVSKIDWTVMWKLLMAIYRQQARTFTLHQSAFFLLPGDYTNYAA